MLCVYREIPYPRILSHSQAHHIFIFIVFSFDSTRIRFVCRFLSDKQRMNVALTRARHALYVFGHMKTLKVGKYWKYPCMCFFNCKIPVYLGKVFK